MTREQDSAPAPTGHRSSRPSQRTTGQLRDGEASNEAPPPLVVPARSGERAGIRPLERGDLEKTALLFLSTFYPAAAAKKGAEVERVAAYMDRVYLGGPHSGSGVNSLVYANAAGEIGGFLGMQKMRYRLDGVPLSACIVGGLMSAGGREFSRVGAQLLRAVNGLGFDLVFTDSANRRSLAFGPPLRYRILATNCLEWVYPLQPVAMTMHRLKERWPSLPFSLLRPVEFVGERLAVRIVGGKLGAPETASGRVEVADAATFAATLQTFVADFRLRPDWDEDELAWLVGCAADTHRHGRLNLRLVRDTADRPIGCFAFYGERGRPARILQIQALPKGWGPTLDHLLREAQAMGCLSVVGQAQTGLLQQLHRFPGVLFYYTGGTMIRFREATMASGLADTDILIGGLAGDRWTRLSSGEI